ncbi:MAG TPA: cyclic nucleotide-binding domain-containing protein [Clostridiales bacterium]|nr:cyclic nucleotide-binding domain-containing protein [Clostridiales bacterium]
MNIIKDDVILDSILKDFELSKYFTDFQQIQPGIKLITFPKNTYIFSLDQHKRYLYFLISGRMNVYSNAANGNRMLIRYCDNFIMVGDMELLGYPEASNTIQTMSKCIFIGIDINMKALLMNDTKFLQFLCNNLAEKLVYFASNQRSNRLNSAQQNIAEHILSAANTEGYFKENLRKVAEVYGISYRHLHRTLSTFVENGILSRHKEGYKILNHGALLNIASQDNF